MSYYSELYESGLASSDGKVRSWTAVRTGLLVNRTAVQSNVQGPWRTELRVWFSV
jgi:hypothetical protein